jgi:hypothetical protein
MVGYEKDVGLAHVCLRQDAEVPRIIARAAIAGLRPDANRYRPSFTLSAASGSASARSACTPSTT